MKKNILVILTAYFITQFNVCYAQPINFSGKSFYFAIYVVSGMSSVKICVCSLQGTNGYIVNSINDTTYFAVAANTCDTLHISPSMLVDISGAKAKVGYKITTQEDATVYIYNAIVDTLTTNIAGAFPTSALIYPNTLLGTNYLLNGCLDGLYITVFFKRFFFYFKLKLAYGISHHCSD